MLPLRACWPIGSEQPAYQIGPADAGPNQGVATMMTKANARMRIAREISDAETALNEALLKQSQLFATLLVARRDVAESQFAGQDALLRLAKSQQALLAAGSDLARVHSRLAEINQATGDLGSDCPDDWRHWSHNEDTIAA